MGTMHRRRRGLQGWAWAVAFGLAFIVWPLSARAQTGEAESAQGTFRLRASAEAEFAPAPALHTDVFITVSGIVARTTVRQRFLNVADAWMEGVYVFPLPETGAVDHLRMVVGERVIEGEIREREAARQTYERARQAGQRASLVQQERPNVFTTAVANIPPGGEITVEIEYQETVRYADGAYRLRFPLTIVPRYTPDGGEEEVQTDPAGLRGLRTAAPTEVAWRPRTHVAPAGDAASANAVSLVVSLDPGWTLGRLDCTSHAVVASPELDRRYLIALAEGEALPNRDFELVWGPAASTEPILAAFAERVGGDTYVMAMITPPQVERTAAARLPREIVFVMDTSGSMHGASLEQAQGAVGLALRQLGSTDRFNIIEFNDGASALFGSSEPASPQAVERAIRYVEAMHADGGTNMRPAIEAALAEDARGAHVRQVVFLTDGAVGNEEELFRVIESNLGRSRLFPVGIGAAPNSHFMSRAAQFGRGTFTYIGSTDAVEERMGALLDTLTEPTATDVVVEAAGVSGGDWFPQRIPDLYAGEPVVVVGRFPELPGGVSVHGRTPNGLWSVELPVDGEQRESGLAVLWARRKIAALMDEGYATGKWDDVRPHIVDVALHHHLVSKYTSLVAVDKTPERSRANPLQSGQVANVAAEAGTGAVIPLAQTATWAPVHLLVGVLALTVAAVMSVWRRRLA